MRVLLAIALTLGLSPWCAAEDWTTTDGKTYHDVKDLEGNTLERTISSREGKVTVALANLPPDLQKRFHYDAAREKAMDQYLIQVRTAPIVLSVPPDPARIKQYAAQVKALLIDPTVLWYLSPEQLVWLQMNRLDVGGYLSYKMTPADAADLKKCETQLIGFMLMAIESKVDPKINTKTFRWEGDTSPEAQAQSDQLQIHRQIHEFVWLGHIYLVQLYGGPYRTTPIDPIVRPILTEAHVDAAAIDLLVGKTKATDP